MTETVCVLKKVQDTMCKAFNLIVKAKEPHTVAETLIMPAYKEMVETVVFRSC